MIIKFKNFVIEYDRYGYSLSEYSIAVTGANAGQEYVSEQIWPSTLEKCFERILHRIKRDARGVFTITQIIPELKRIHEEFLKDLEQVTFTKKLHQEFQKNLDEDL